MLERLDYAINLRMIKLIGMKCLEARNSKRTVIIALPHLHSLVVFALFHASASSSSTATRAEAVHVGFQGEYKYIYGA